MHGEKGEGYTVHILLDYQNHTRLWLTLIKLNSVVKSTFNREQCHYRYCRVKLFMSSFFSL